jgi:hypothetical protein
MKKVRAKHPAGWVGEEGFDFGRVLCPSGGRAIPGHNK